MSTAAAECCEAAPRTWSHSTTKSPAVASKDWWSESGQAITLAVGALIDAGIEMFGVKIEGETDAVRTVGSGEGRPGAR